MPIPATVLVYSLLAAAASALGMIPLMFLKAVPARSVSLSGALASGLLLAAAFQLMGQGSVENPGTTILGIFAGLALITVSRHWLDGRASPAISRLARTDMLGAVIMIGVMTIHSFPEGIAVGLALGRSMRFGSLICLVIALHNIPEGLAIGLVLVAQGVQVWKAGLWSIFASLPQPLMAVPAFYLVRGFAPLLPFGLGLASGAMIWMIGAEVLPEACGKASPRGIGVALTIGVVAMLSLEWLI